MRLFWKIFTAVFIALVGAVLIIAYFTTIRQIKNAERHIVEEYTFTGDSVSLEIEHCQVESKWPFDRLNRLSKQGGFLFWWVVREDGVIHLADRAALMGTRASDYFPQVNLGDLPERILLNREKNYGLFITPLEIGKKRWTFWLGFSLTQIWEIKKHIILLSLLVSMAAFLGLGTILYLVIGHFVKPVGDLTLGAALIGNGELSHRVEINSRDEIGQLAKAFNQMAADLEITTVSRDYMDSILETMPGALIVVNAEARIIANNKSACRILGYAREELMGAPLAKVLGQDCSLGPQLEKLFEGDLTNWELSYQTKDGRQVPVFLSSTVRRDAAGQISYIVCIAIDITEHKQSEAALVESEGRFRDLAENAVEWIWEVDSQGKYTYSSPVVEKLLGFKPEEIMKKHFYDLFHPEDREDLKQGAFRFFEQKLPFRDFVTRNINKNGETVWISTSAVPILDEQGNLKGYRGAGIDITARHQAEEALRANERFLTAIFTSIQDGISILDKDYNIIRVNAAMEEAYSQARPLAGKKCYAAYHGRSNPCKTCPTRRTLETGQAAHEVVIERGANKEILRYIDLFTFPLIDTSSGKLQGVVESVRDITPQKQAEEALRRSEENLRQSQKMEAVGRLAGGVAHDFNNILTAIIGYSELLGGKFEPGDSRLNDMEEIHQAAERAASLTRQLLAFSRKQIFAPRVLNLNNLINNLDKMLRRLLSEDIKLVTIPAENLGEVLADPGQIEQVIINLAVNARDAMPRGGVITIETQNVYLDAHYAQK
ncbi:MAG: PAS domain S-box protein, partial [Deltaproteobacteria bacterium]|nr:PAS domain S-box protein [Deltaproteobacteria bacterium]